MTIMILLWLLCASTSTWAFVHKYDQFSLIKIEVPDKHARDAINGLKHVKFLLKPHIGDFASIMVSPKHKDQVLDQLHKKHLTYETSSDDIQKDFDKEKKLEIEEKKAALRTGQLANHRMTWTSYHDISDMYSLLRYV